MSRLSQIGIAIGALGTMLAIMGLFPGVTGLPPTPGIGLVQIFILLVGFSLLILGALFYVKFAFYAHREPNLTQQIGTRFALTGLLLAALSGLADSLGFGSHGFSTSTPDVFVGPWQAIGIMSGYAMSCMGVLVYALAGVPEQTEDDSEPLTDTDAPPSPLDSSADTFNTIG